jgi:hypothetical protein
MAKLFPRKAESQKKEDFLLKVALAVSLICLSIVVVTLQFTAAAGGNARVSSAMTAKSNLLHGAIEEGRAKLMEITNNDGPVPRYAGHDDGTGKEYTINSLDSLLINIDLDNNSDTDPGVLKDKTIPASELSRLGIFNGSGADGSFTVKIYDMRYNPAQVKRSAMTEADYNRLPPSILNTMTPTKTIIPQDLYRGAYLVRAALEIDDIKSMLDVAILQANSILIESSYGPIAETLNIAPNDQIVNYYWRSTE